MLATSDPLQPSNLGILTLPDGPNHRVVFGPSSLGSPRVVFGLRFLRIMIDLDNPTVTHCLQ